MDSIEIKPSFYQWIISIVPVFILMTAIILIVLYFDFPFDIEVLGCSMIVFLLYLIWSYLDMCVFRKWTVAEKNIKLEYGILFKNSEFLEIYRIVDYKEYQSLLQMIFRIKTVTIISEDKSTPKLPVFGLKQNFDLIAILRPMVAKERQANHIYEITNR